MPGNEASLDQSQLERLLDVGRSLVSELELEPVLRQVVEAAQELTGARHAALGVLDEEKRALERFLYVGIDEATRRQIGPLPRGRGVLGELIRDPKPLRLAEVREHPRSYGFPAGHPPMRAFLGVPVLIRGEAWGNLYLADKGGAAEFDAQDEQLVVVLAEWAAVAIDNARNYERAEHRRTELERAVRGLEATVSLSREVGGETTRERVLELIVKRGRALIDARGLLLLLPRDGRLSVAEAAGEVEGEVRGRSVELEGSIAGAAYRSGESRRLGERDDIDDLGVEASNMLLVPLTHRGHGEGVIAAFDRLDGAEFSPDDELLLSSFATSAATAVAMVEAVESEKLRLSIASSERERRRWARELHDETLQELGALMLLHDTALKRGDTDVMRRSLERARDQIQQTIAGLEGLITELRPAALDELGVAAALEALSDRAPAASGPRVSVDLDLAFGEGRPRLAPELESTVYRLAQEALNNVMKHAEARNVRISMEARDDSLVLTVEDDGGGFEVEDVPERFGLVGMRERVVLAGGELKIDSEPGAGTRVIAKLPIAYAA